MDSDVATRFSLDHVAEAIADRVGVSWHGLTLDEQDEYRELAEAAHGALATELETGDPFESDDDSPDVGDTLDHVLARLRVYRSVARTPYARSLVDEIGKEVRALRDES